MDSVPLMLPNAYDLNVDQFYECYTEQDHATWRTTTHQLTQVLESRCAIPYEAAFKQCGLVTDRLPYLAEIQDALRKFGWDACMVESFIPPRTFLALQARRTLPITRQIRSVRQTGFTPIPDIVHEAAGHLPMLLEPGYRRFLQRFGELGEQLQFSALDEKVFCAQKHYAEYVALRQKDSNRQADLLELMDQLKKQQQTELTPACLLSRLHWWTVEYGLIGNEALIYGAGLLSSSDEAQLINQVDCLPLDESCLTFQYEISTMQPQLFVAEDWSHLVNELNRIVRLIV